MKELDNCIICPRECAVNRNKGKKGYCGSDSGYHVGSICVHRGEEPPISGTHGICNVFFTGCNLHCLYCQNFQISRRTGRLERSTYTLEQVSGEIISILDQGIEAVGFVSPTHFTPHVKAIINNLHEKGYKPVTVYNTSGYDKVDILKSLEGIIDVYLPDFKYMDPLLASTWSDAANYPYYAKMAITEMYRQKGSTLVLDDLGRAVTGMIIRLLVLPGRTKDAKRILDWIAENLSTSVHISLLSQYSPTISVMDDPQLGRELFTAEYEEVLKAMENLGFDHGWIQKTDSSENYIPDFSRSKPFE